MMGFKTSLTAAGLALAFVGLSACSEAPTSIVSENGYAIDVLELDGTDTLAFDPAPAFEPASQSTIEFWVQPKWEETPEFDPVVLASSGTDGAAYLIAIQREKDGLSVISGDQVDVTPFDFNDGELHHVALIDLGGPVGVVIDGELIDELDMTFQAMETEGFYIGSANGGEDGFEGIIGGLRIWDAAVTMDNLVKFQRKDVLAEDDPHPDLDYLSVISDFTQEDIVVVKR